MRARKASAEEEEAASASWSSRTASPWSATSWTSSSLTGRRPVCMATRRKTTFIASVGSCACTRWAYSSSAPLFSMLFWSTEDTRARAVSARPSWRAEVAMATATLAAASASGWRDCARENSVMASSCRPHRASASAWRRRSSSSSGCASVAVARRAAAAWGLAQSNSMAARCWREAFSCGTRRRTSRKMARARRYLPSPNARWPSSSEAYSCRRAACICCSPAALPPVTAGDSLAVSWSLSRAALARSSFCARRRSSSSCRSAAALASARHRPSSASSRLLPARRLPREKYDAAALCLPSAAAALPARYSAFVLRLSSASAASASSSAA
mmetsp:Transcript_10394/g.42280  ORF Transcript_10394/g.42280 Transcript_10394/m.42280 type:complete len:330 (-) Transcript_10394:571-1560(-)